MQRKWYRSVLEKDIDAVNGRFFDLKRKFRISDALIGLTGKKEGKARLMNLVMQLRKGWSPSVLCDTLSNHCGSGMPSISI